MGSYRRITWEDRIQIKALSEASIKAEEIGCQLGFDRSTIYRELRRNRGGKGYRPQQAQAKAEERQEWRSQPRKMGVEMIRTVERLIGLKWSPEQITNRLELEGQTSVSYETIYHHVYMDYKSGGTLFTHLRFGHRTRKPRFPRGKGDRRGIIKNALSIEQRPDGANNRTHYGHWERDTMFGSDKKNSVLLMADRKSRFVRLGKLSRRTADLTLAKTKELLKGLRYRTMTNDRGREFTDHEQLTADLKMPVFFCHPYSSSERGTVENRIGILRQYLPKGTDLKYLKHSTLRNIEEQINSRPMKCLDWKTPLEVMYGTNVALTT